MSKESGFTLIEIIVSLVIAGIMVAVAGMGLTTGVKGYVFAKENAHMAQKAQLALARLNREFMELLDITTPTSSSIIYELTTGDRAIAKVGDTIKIRDGSTLPDAANGDILLDNVNSFTLTYYKASSIWVPGTDSIQYLSAINIDLVLDRADSGIGMLTFSTLVHPRNTNNYGGASPTANPPTKSDYGCFVSTTAGDLSAERKTNKAKKYVAISGILLFILSICSMVLGHSKKNKRRFPSSLYSEKGSILISLIATMVIFSALGAAMLPLTSTSTFSHIGINNSTRAYFLAESAYRYAASEYLNAGSEAARDAVLSALHNQTSALTNNDGQFHINIYSHWFKSTVDPVDTEFLSTTVLGGLPSGMNLDKGFLSIDGTVYEYKSVVVSDPNVTFKNKDGDWPAISVGSAASNVALSKASAQTVTKNGDLILRDNDKGANAFPLRNGQIQVDGNTYNYRELDLANKKLIGITDPDDDSMPDFTVAASSWITQESFVKVQCTGTSAPGSGMETSRTITYSTPIGWVSRVEAASGKTEVSDSFADTSNWQSSTYGSHAAASEDGSNALDVTGKYRIPSTTYDTSEIRFNWSATDADLAASWENFNYFLNYDAQTKIMIHSESYFFAGINFRVSGSDSYGLSFLQAAADSADGIPTGLVPVTEQPLVLLWEHTGFAFKWLAYKTLTSSDHIFTENTYFSDDMESGKGSWSSKDWDLTEEDANSLTHSWTDSPGGNYAKKSDTEVKIENLDLSSVSYATLSFWHKLDVGSKKDDAIVSVKEGKKWKDLETYSADIGTWQKATFDISGYLPGKTGVRFRLTADKKSPGADGWYIDDVTISYEALDWPTLLVRVEEKIADSGRFSGLKVNDIRAYIGDVNAHGTSGKDPLDNDRKANPRDQVNWPPDDVDDTESTNDYFTLVQWNSSVDTSVDRIGTGNELNAVIRSNSLTTPTSGSFTQSELALHTYGWTSDSVFFDDFALQLGKAYGGGIGFLNPVQE